MFKALSVDLRERVVAAVTAGSSCRAAAVRWAALVQDASSVAPRPLGGDRHSLQIEAHVCLKRCYYRRLHHGYPVHHRQNSDRG